MTTTALPTTVVLWCCPAEADSGRKIRLSGIFEIVEHFGYEPAAYVHAPGFLIARSGNFSDAAPSWWVDEDALMEQVDPESYGRMLVQERETDLREDFQEEYPPHWACPMNVPGEMDQDDEDKGHLFAPTGRQEGHTDYWGGPQVGVELRCSMCGLTKWDVS